MGHKLLLEMPHLVCSASHLWASPWRALALWSLQHQSLGPCLGSAGPAQLDPVPSPTPTTLLLLWWQRQASGFTKVLTGPPGSGDVPQLGAELSLPDPTPWMAKLLLPPQVCLHREPRDLGGSLCMLRGLSWHIFTGNLFLPLHFPWDSTGCSGSSNSPRLWKMHPLFTTLQYEGAKMAYQAILCVLSQSWNIASSLQKKRGGCTTQISRL